MNAVFGMVWCHAVSMTAQCGTSRKNLARGLDAGDVRRIVQGGKIGKLAEGGQGVIVDDHRLGEPVPAVHHPVAHGLDLGEVVMAPTSGSSRVCTISSIASRWWGQSCSFLIFFPLFFE